MPRTTIALTDQLSVVRTIVAELHAAGFTTDDISVVFPRHHAAHDPIYPADLPQATQQSGQGAVIGAVAGGTLGTALAWLTGVGVIAVPGLAPLLAAGPFLTIFTGMGLGASIGGVAGALAGMGVSEIDAKRFASSISDGRLLVAVRSEDEDDAHVAEKIMRHANGPEVTSFTWPQEQRHAMSAGH